MLNAKIMGVVGARPNFMKMAPAIVALEKHPGLRVTLVHTGQHYDAAMSGTFLQQLGIREPDHRLNVGSASHAVQTAWIMERIEPIMISEAPKVVLVAGDVNSTIAAALVAIKLNIPVAHIEAGLRSFDRQMPEEINRIVVDRISDILYTTEDAGRRNLLSEGVSPSQIVFVGNLMIDTLLASLKNAVPVRKQVFGRFGESAAGEVDGGYAVLTLHRPSNVDDPETLIGLLAAIKAIAQDIPVLFPVHPRTQQRIGEIESDIAGVYMMPPLSYFEMLGLTKDARLVLTDSGGLQEETTALGIPCLTLRENTERPITVEQGTNTVVGVTPGVIIDSARKVLCGKGKIGRVPAGWDGHAATRLATHLANWLSAKDLTL